MVVFLRRVWAWQQYQRQQQCIQEREAWYFFIVLRCLFVCCVFPDVCVSCLCCVSAVGTFAFFVLPLLLCRHGPYCRRGGYFITCVICLLNFFWGRLIFCAWFCTSYCCRLFEGFCIFRGGVLCSYYQRLRGKYGRLTGWCRLAVPRMTDDGYIFSTVQ